MYKPFGLIVGLLGGIAARSAFRSAWRFVANEEKAPDAKDLHRGWAEIVLAAAFQGAVFGAVRALVNRAGAIGFARATGVWPGRTEPPRSGKA